MVSAKIHRRRNLLAAGLLAAGMMFPAGPPVRADEATPTEYDVKAVFLFNFAKFVEWPPEALQNTHGTFVIGILGADPFEKPIEQELEQKTIQDKKLVFRKLSSPDQVPGCQVVFISASEENNLGSILDVLKRSPVLVVGDTDGFIERGGMVGFVVEDNRVQFNINLIAAEKAQLKISSQLLKLAKTVRRLPVREIH